jgi:hypothetical protein
MDACTDTCTDTDTNTDTDSEKDKDNLADLQNCSTSPPTTDDDILIHRTAPPSIRTSLKSASSTAPTPVVDLT